MGDHLRPRDEELIPAAGLADVKESARVMISLDACPMEPILTHCESGPHLEALHALPVLGHRAADRKTLRSARGPLKAAPRVEHPVDAHAAADGRVGQDLDVPRVQVAGVQRPPVALVRREHEADVLLRVWDDLAAPGPRHLLLAPPPRDAVRGHGDAHGAGSRSKGVALGGVGGGSAAVPHVPTLLIVAHED